jgi:hypothetical protein
MIALFNEAIGYARQLNDSKKFIAKCEKQIQELKELNAF